MKIKMPIAKLKSGEKYIGLKQTRKRKRKKVKKSAKKK